MKLADFHYELPASAIAQEPALRRDASRLMVLGRHSPAIQHSRFIDLPDFLEAGDVLVLNATKVFPARLRGKKSSGGKIEILLVQPLGAGWKALVRGTRKPATLEFPEGLKATMEERLENGEWRIQFSHNHISDYLERHGEMPLPPYIKRPAPRASDIHRYQTVFAAQEGAIAAPTAGFHFTDALLKRLKDKGVQVETILLHVGWGTFRPVRVDDVATHQMLAERYEVSPQTAAALDTAKREKRRIIAVGTTVTRTLESRYEAAQGFQSGQGETDLFIYPGYTFRAIDALLTNFHLPDSTPLLLACAFYGDSKGVGEYGSMGVTAKKTSDNTPLLPSPPAPLLPFSLRRAYSAAIQEGYRFYSYGDAMFIQ